MVNNVYVCVCAHVHKEGDKIVNVNTLSHSVITKASAKCWLMFVMEKTRVSKATWTGDISSLDLSFFISKIREKV